MGTWDALQLKDFILNCDGSVNHCSAGFGCSIRRQDESWITGLAGNCLKQDVILNELLTIWHGLRFVILISLSEVHVYTDSLEVIRLLSSNNTIFHHFACLLQEIRDIFTMHPTFSISHTLREGNAVADGLASQFTFE